MLYRKNILDFLFLRLPGLNAQNHRLYKKRILDLITKLFSVIIIHSYFSRKKNVIWILKPTFTIFVKEAPTFYCIVTIESIIYTIFLYEIFTFIFIFN